MSLTTDAAVPNNGEAGTGTRVIAARGITEHFGSIQALRSVDLDVHRGEVVGLMGDNGAGKSTLVNILSEALQPNTVATTANVGSPAVSRYCSETSA